MVVPSASAATTTSPEWQTETSTGSNFTHAMSIQIGNVVYVIGGTNDSVYFTPVNTTHSYNIATGAWTALANTLRPVRDGAVATDGTSIYVFGGDTEAGYSDYVQIYTIANNTWHAGKRMPVGSIESKAVFWEGTFHVVGGYNNTETYMARDQVFDPSTNSWNSSDPIPAARFGGSFAVVEGAMVYIGGISSFTASNTVFIKWPGSNWTTGSPAPIAFSAAATTVGADGLIYVMGGEPDDYYVHNTTMTMWYDIDRDAWGAGADLPIALNFASAASSSDGKIFVLGGNNFRTTRTNVTSLRIMTMSASLASASVNSGADEVVSISVSFAYRNVNYFEGTARLQNSVGDDLVVQAFDSVDSTTIEFKVTVPESAATGQYTINIERIRVHELNDRTFLIGVSDMTFNVAHVASEQEQIDDLNENLTDSNDRIDELENDVSGLKDDLKDKADQTMMLLALVIALVGVILAIVAIVMTRRK